MKNKKLFDKTISILVNAYLKGTLIHGKCQACVVGNLIVAHNNYSMINGEWDKDGVYKPSAAWYNDLVNRRNNPYFKSIGYTLLKAIKIEGAFEMYNDEDETGYLGLMAVVDALIEIHQGTKDHKKETKELFNLNIN